MLALDFADDIGQHPVGVKGILSPLHHKCAESQRIARFGARLNFFGRQTVALRFGIPPADAAVKAVILTVVGKLNQTADIDFVAVTGLTGCPCERRGVFSHFVPVPEQRQVFVT